MERKIAFSKALPEFEKTALGTQVFAFSDERAVTLYDDYSPYPKAEAKLWKVEAYSRSDGHRIERICTHKGKFAEREKALAEVNRFRYRGRDLVFYVIPSGFTYDRVSYIWGDDDPQEGTATYSEQAEEARRRLLAMTGRTPEGETDIRRRKISSDALEAFCMNDIAAEHGLFPFAVVSGCTVLYVSADKSVWKVERMLMCDGYRGEYDSYDGIIPAFVKYPWSDDGEFGDIAYKKVGRHICRVR